MSDTAPQGHWYGREAAAHDQEGGNGRVAVILVFKESSCWQVGQQSQLASLKCLMAERMAMYVHESEMTQADEGLKP